MKKVTKLYVLYYFIKKKKNSKSIIGNMKLIMFYTSTHLYYR